MSLLDEIKKRAQSAVKAYTQQDDVQKRLNDYAASNKVSTYSDVKNTVKQAFQPVLNIVDNVRSKPAENWYKGDQPTRRETLARIYDISNEDASRGETLFNMYEAELSDPTSPFYNPYTQATTSKANKTNLANTAKAQEEWARLSDELSYWATRSDRNYSDDEIIARIDWDNYKTLQKMDEGRRSGSPIALTEAVGYSEDAMYGVLWAARNPDAATGDAMMDAAQSALGRGNQYKRDEGIANKLDPTNASYNPYTVGSTVDDLAYKYGVNSFDDKWLEDHRDLLRDPDTAKDYGKIYDAVQDTNAFQAESAAFKEELARYAEKGVLPDYDYLLQQPEYKNLAKLQESLKSGQIMDTASAIDFDLPTLKAESEAAYALKQAQLNAGKDPAALGTAVEAEKQSWFQRIGARASELLSGWFKDDPIPESETSKPDTLYDEDPAASLVGGMMWAGASSPRAVSDEQRQRMLMMSGDLPMPEPDTVPESVDESIGGAMSDEQRQLMLMMSGDLPLPEAKQEPTAPSEKPKNEYSIREILAAVEEGNYELAAGMNYEDIMRKLEEDPELLVTDNAQKAILFSLALVGELDTPESQEATREYAAAAETAMGLDTSNAVYGFIDEAFGGALSETSGNEGVGFWRTVQYALMSGGDKFNDVLANIAGTVVTGYGYAVEGVNKVMNWLGVEGTIPMAEKLQQAGADVANYYDEKLQAQEKFMRENATTAEYLGYTAGSEAVKMAGMGTVAQGIGAAAGNVDKVATALEANKLATATKLLTMSPFVAESASAEFQDSIQKSDNFLTSVLSASIVGFATMATSDVGVLKNIEKMGKGALPEIVDALASVPGVGVRAAAKRWGKGMLMYMGNLIKTGINEGFQEAFENVLGTSATAGLKGEEFKFDREYGAELTRDAIMGAIGSFSSIIGVMPNYAESVIVANANAHKSVLTPADVKAQMDAFANDLNNPEVMDTAKTAAAELAVGARTGELVAQGALGEIDSSAVDNAAAKLAEAEPAEQAANEAVARADEKFKANMADDAAANELMSAIDDQASDQKAADDARAELASAQTEQAAAATEAMNAVREQARAEVTQNMAAVQEARLQQEAAAEVQRQNDNVLALQADDFVNEYMANAPDDVKDQVRERYMAYDGETQNATRGMVEFASQISKKFNLSITFTDSHGIFEGAYKGGNTIVLDKNATQGEVIRRVLVHEITHAAESSKAYDALADAVLSAYYEGNTDQMNADLATIAQQYSEQAGQDGQSVSRSELVAQRLSEMLSGNQDALNRLVAEKPDVATRIWRAIKEFIGKLSGVRDPELDKLMKLEKQLEKALGSRTTSTSGTQFMIERGAGGVDVVVVEEDILDGVTVRDWPKVVRSVMVSRFPDGVPVGSNVIRINRDTRKEVTNSKDTMWLKHNDFSTYQDKLRATANSDEIIKASRDYVNEAPAHERKDRIVDFARGEVSMRIGGKEYDAEVVVGYDLDGNMRLYDFVRMTRTDEKKAGQPFEDEPSRDSRAGLSELSVSENGSLVKQVSDGAEIIRGGATKFSLTSWTEKEKTEVRKNLIQNGYGPANVDKWIDNVNSVAAIIAGDKARLDYKAADNQVMLKNNQEYVKTLDASTLCAKRLLYQGTFNEIQHMLPNTVLTSEDLLRLSDMMNQAGLETPCGVCYVESRLRHLGKFAQEWLDGYNGEYKPTLDEVTTTDGLEALRINHPETYRSFVDTMNSKGSANPKVVQLRTDYRGDIRKLTKGETKKIIKIGGLRIQSFSDFETPHLIDMMQAVLDMSSRKLPAQAYTKVPNFAWVFGDTGIKINLSLLAEGNGLNEDGTLRFSSKEGMDIDEAMRLRERYSENVGTILVGVSEEHIRAAMADPRIDYIIPFHKSGWGQNELNLLPVLNSYDNFEDYQNERTVVGYRKNGKPKYGRPKGGNFYPIDYWDYSKTGDENAATYLRMCEEDGRIPKFEQFLEKDADGHWVAPSGYWKMLIDFKMYDNDGNGAPQKAVLPIFNMEEAERVLKEYEGGADTLPVAYDIADRFVAEKKGANPGAKFSLSKTETEVRDKTYLKAVEEGDTDTARRMVMQKAQEEGFANAVPEQTLAYAVRKGAPPKKTIKVYKVFTVSPDGKPTALFVSGTEELPQNVWLDAQDTWHFTAKNGHEYVPSTQNPYTDGGKTGAQVEVPNDEIRAELIKRGFLPEGSKAKAVTALAYRPGWHAGDLPFFPQGGMKREGSNYENIHRYNQVVFECEFDADHDYTEEALNQDKAKTKKGTINYRNADLQYMPTGGFYKYATNPLTMQGGHGAWFIGGSLKIGRALTQQECDAILEQNGFLPQEWEQGELDLSTLGYTGEQFDAAKKTLAPVTYDNEGNVIPLSKRFDKTVNDIRFSLPSNDILDQRIAQHRNSQLTPAPNNIIPRGGEPEQNYGTGERQFAGQTIQNSAVVPDWIKQEFLRPEELNYETDTNREQVERSWQRIQENGYEAERDRLLGLDRYSADDTAEANLMMAMALREDTADPATFMALASHYNKEGTKAGQELQARKLFTRMSPTGARVWAAGQMESNLEEHMRTHRPQRRRIDDAAREVADQIRDMQDGDELLRLNAGGDFTIDESNNRWGIPINEQQQALIDHYGLNNVARPGIFYNRATTKQRMLEAILATPNPLEVTGLGLNLIQRLEFMQDGEAVITNADLNYIGTQLGQFVAQGGDEGGREADLAVSRAYEAYGNITPSTTREKLRTWRYVSMLLSVPSAIRNVIGNTSQNVVNATAHGIAVELDKALARATGQRTVEHLNYQERIDGWRGFVEETQNTFRDYFIDLSVTQRGNDKYNTNQRGRVYQTQFIETMRNMEGFLMSFGDRNTWRKAYLNSMAEQQNLADRNLLFNDDGTTRTHEQMLEQAEADANYATFTEDNAVSNVLSQLKNIPGVGEVIDFIMPFTGVPTNITRRMIQYSPIGLAATALRHGYRAATRQNFDQRAFVHGISRGLTGTALFGVGMLLAAAGVIKPGTGDEDDDKKYGLKTAMGGQYTPYVYNPLTDEYVSLAAFAPAASPLTMGLAAYEEFRNNKDWLQALISSCFSGADQIFDASYMSGVQDIFKGYGSPAENITNAVFSNAVSQSVPALLTQLSNTLDPYVRDTKDKNAIVQALKSGLINRIPGLRQMLPEKVDVTGQTVRTKEGLRNFYDPFTTTDARKDPAVDELFRLSEALGSSSMLPSDALSGSKMTLNVPSNGKVTVDAEGKETYRKRYGELWLEGGTTIDKNGRPVVVEGVRRLINSSAYQMMDDEERSDAIADIIYEAKIGAMMEALNKYGAD